MNKMIPLIKFKELLREEADNLTDEEIEEIRNAQYQFAELAFDSWAKENKIKRPEDN